MWKAHDVRRETVSADVGAFPRVPPWLGASDSRYQIAPDRAARVVLPMRADQEDRSGMVLGFGVRTAIPERREVDVQEVVDSVKRHGGLVEAALLSPEKVAAPFSCREASTPSN